MRRATCYTLGWKRPRRTPLATEIRAQLQPQLVPRYVAVLTPYEDIIIGEPAVIKPDVAVMQQRDALRPTTPATGAVPAPILGVTALAEPEVPAKAQRIEIRTVSDESLVTVIEILSPSNKRPGTESFEAYQRKRRDLLRSDVHLLELDLLRRGVRWPLETPLPDVPCFVFLSRARPSRSGRSPSATRCRRSRSRCGCRMRM